MKKQKLVKNTFGDVFTMEEFFYMVYEGYINNYDGFGKYSDGTFELGSINNVYLLDISFSHVVWYNK